MYYIVCFIMGLALGALFRALYMEWVGKKEDEIRTSYFFARKVDGILDSELEKLADEKARERFQRFKENLYRTE